MNCPQLKIEFLKLQQERSSANLQDIEVDVAFDGVDRFVYLFGVFSEDFGVEGAYLFHYVKAA